MEWEDSEPSAAGEWEEKRDCGESWEALVRGKEVTGRDSEVRKCVWYGSGLLSSVPEVSPSPQADLPVTTVLSGLPTIPPWAPVARSLTQRSLHTTVLLTAPTVSPHSPQGFALSASVKGMADLIFPFFSLDAGTLFPIWRRFDQTPPLSEVFPAASLRARVSGLCSAH